MAESYDHMAGSEMDVNDHPANNIEHPDPGPGRAKAVGIGIATALGNPLTAGPTYGALAAVGLAAPAISVYKSLTKK